MALSALFHDVGKAIATVIHETGRITAHGHEKDSKKITSEILVDLGADSKLKEDVLFLVFRHMIAHSKDTNVKTLDRLILEAGTELVDQLLLHGVADVKAGCGDLTDCIRLRELFESMDKQRYTERDPKFVKDEKNDFKAVIFDCDGTLIDSEGSHFYAWQKVVLNRDHHFSLEDFIQCMGNASPAIAQKLAIKMNSPSAEELLSESRDYYQRHAKTGQKPIQHTVEFALKLAKEKERLGIKLAVASAGKKDEILRSLKQIGIDEIF
ncbi:MAG: HAD hydrolase-like protein, partial [Parachlamydiaceae bacterium]